MVHVRTVNDEVEVFGNYGALFMNAMTWYDHTTGSVWSQVWGRAIDGPLKGSELELIPSQTVPWSTWKAQHPNTLLMTNGLKRFHLYKERFFDDYIIGIEVGGVAKGYPFVLVARQGVVNDMLGDIPLVVIVDGESGAVSSYVRTADGQVLTFFREGDALIDHETGSYWNSINGLATSGSLAGQALRPIPYVPAYDEAWYDFFPHTEMYSSTGD
jgi:hypothetical protein